MLRISNIIAELRHLGVFFASIALTAVLLQLSSCYQMDDDAPKVAMADKREAQAYIVTSYNKLNKYLVRSDFEALGRLGSIMDEYQWDNKEASMQQAKKYAKMILQGNIYVFQDMMNLCERNSGIYEADANKYFHKTADAEHQIKLIFNQQATLSATWDVKEKSSNKKVIDFSFYYNQYRLAGQSRVYNDSVCTSFRMTKEDITLIRLDRTLEGRNILAALNGQSGDDMSLFSIDLRLQFMDMLCLHETEIELSYFLRYFEENHTLQAENPKKFLEGFINMRNNMSRVVLTRPDGTVLCKVIDEVGMRDGKSCIIPMLNWGDDTQESLTDFASNSANENFSKDGALLDKLWQLLYNLYYE